ncbi:hypothetical protein SOVF_159800 isoform B [Spinacia oleracea]|nr:hypothetical protein SOVF_159800 isoform B [Spinacia oleracea]
MKKMNTRKDDEIFNCKGRIGIAFTIEEQGTNWVHIIFHDQFILLGNPLVY